MMNSYDEKRPNNVIHRTAKAAGDAQRSVTRYDEID
jgi:hypothetical protein